MSEDEYIKSKNPTLAQLNDFRDKRKYLLEGDAGGSEFIVNGAEAGKRLGLSPDTRKVPTAKELNDMINKYLKEDEYYPFFDMLKHTTDSNGNIQLKYPGYSWKLFTGQYQDGGKLKMHFPELE